MILSKSFLFDKLKAFTATFSIWLLLSLRIQLVLFLVALPILSQWGLPLSYASILSNLLFAPWATVFLGLSTLWLVTHLCGIPAAPIAYCLERVTEWWLWCLSWGSSSMLFAIPSCHPIIAVCIPLTACMLLYSTVRTRFGLPYEVLALSCLALAWCGALTTLASSRSPVPLAHGGGTLWLCPHKNGVSLVDNKGVLRNLSSSSSWVNFSLAPALARNFGACRCYDIILLKPTIARLYAAAALIRAGKAQAIAVPSWIMQKKWWLNWVEKNHDIGTKCIEEKDLIIAYDQ